MISRWLSNTLWQWTRSLRRTPAITKAQDARRRSSLRGHTQGQHKASCAAYDARNAGLLKEVADMRRRAQRLQAAE